MKKFLITLIPALAMFVQSQAQVEPGAGNWKTWLISSGKEYRLPAPSSHKQEIAQVLAAQKNLDSATMQHIVFWNAGAPGYRWQNMINSLWQTDTSLNGALANLLIGVGIYDATVAAWDTKYAYNRPRPFTADSKIVVYGPKLESPSYPCEYSVAAGVATTIISKFYPKLADSVNKMAQQLMASRIAGGNAFPSDTRAGFDLGKKIAEAEIERTRDFVTTLRWDGTFPQQPGIWKGRFAMFATAGKNKTMVLESASQFRPGPPPDWTKDMAELKNQKQTFRSQSNAFYWASQNFWGDELNKKIFEYNLHTNAPRAARIYAVADIAAYDALAACFDAKYAYWGIRPDQYDTTYKSLVPTPPFPGYPSGHAVMSGMYSELYSYFFPADKAYYKRKAQEAADSRAQAGIHFRTDNEVGLDLGRKVGNAVIQKINVDGAGSKNLTPI
ncbi:MAG TPA: phosphatase PAP2 family protein [Chitinophagaceae bacterium]|nr:phosphatase PAP2 family protein [Chitinophagaceae bacterium]